MSAAQPICFATELIRSGVSDIFSRESRSELRRMARGAYARHLDQEVAETEDGAEGSRAFREKRRPH